MRRTLATVGFCLAAALTLATPARAADFNFTASGGGSLNLSASVNITDLGGGQLQITLSNIGGEVLAPNQVLTALFFNCTCGTLTPISAVLGPGSTVFFDAQGQPLGGVVGGEWAYGSGLALPGGATQGISSFGGGLFGNPNFPGADLDPPTAVNGLNYGIVSAVDNLATGNAEVTGNVPLVQNSVVFVMGYTGSINPATAFSNVVFQYGTALTEPNIGGGSGGGSGQTLVPEPASLLLLGSGLFAAAYRVRRKKQQQNAV